MGPQETHNSSVKSPIPSYESIGREILGYNQLISMTAHENKGNPDPAPGPYGVLRPTVAIYKGRYVHFKPCEGALLDVTNLVSSRNLNTAPAYLPPVNWYRRIGPCLAYPIPEALSAVPRYFLSCRSLLAPLSDLFPTLFHRVPISFFLARHSVKRCSVLPTPATPPALVGLYPSRSADQGPGMAPR